MGNNNPFNLNQDMNIGKKDWGSPFATYARQHYPRTLTEVFNWAEYLWLHQGVYTKAIQRAVRYFLTKVEIVGTADFKTKRKYVDFLQDKLNILDRMAIIGDDYMAYGNSFTSVYKPFFRNLVCPKCKFMKPIQQVKYKWTDYEFHGKCTKCKKEVTFQVNDITDKSDDLRIIRWNPRHIDVEAHPMSGEVRYYYNPEGAQSAKIKKGEKIFVEHTPMEIIDAMKNDERFRFNDGEIYHMKCEPAASLLEDVGGWGLPPFLANFEHVIHLQMLTKYNEAICMDMIVPFRFISPGAKGSGPHNDPLLTIDAGNFMRSVESMIKKHRKDPTSIHSVPYPVQYQAMGGEAKALAPVELLKFALDELLTSMGIPQEFYKQDLQGGGPPIGLRMFERSWVHFVSQMNNWLDWLVKQCSNHLMWEDIGAKLTKTSVLEDDLVRQTKLNLLGANKVSNQTALSAFNIDYEYEVDKIMEEQQMFDEKTQEMARTTGKAQEGQAQMDQPLPPPGAPIDPGMLTGAGAPQGAAGMAIPGGGGGGGMPMPGGGGGAPAGGGTSMDELHIQAEQMAQQILTMDPTTRRSELVNLKHGDETLHALVTSKLKTMEQQAAQTGINMTRQGQMPPGGM
jgi:hypothetical protein